MHSLKPLLLTLALCLCAVGAAVFWRPTLWIQLADHGWGLLLILGISGLVGAREKPPAARA